MVAHNHPKFQLGKIVMTQGAIAALEDSDEGPEVFLKRHLCGLWGNVCESDGELNNQAIANEGEIDKQMRVMSVYHTKKGVKLYCITEYDRSYTTILLPSEY
jgi:hypothetical protein